MIVLPVKELLLAVLVLLTILTAVLLAGEVLSVRILLVVVLAMLLTESVAIGGKTVLPKVLLAEITVSINVDVIIDRLSVDFVLVVCNDIDNVVLVACTETGGFNDDAVAHSKRSTFLWGFDPQC